MVGQGELGASSIFKVHGGADELRRSVVEGSARRSWSRESGSEAPNASSEGSVSVVLEVETCEAGRNDGLSSDDIKGAEPDRSSSPLDGTNGKLMDGDADDKRRA